MTMQEEPERKSRRDLLLVLLILPFGILCMLVTGQAAIRLAPSWKLLANIGSNLDPNAEYAARNTPMFLEPLDPGILTLPALGNSFFTPNAPIPISIPPTSTPVLVRTELPPPAINTPIPPTATATFSGPVIIPTSNQPLRADLAVTKTDNSSTYTPGTMVRYNIVVSNLGPDGAYGFSVSDDIPSVISGLTVTCSPIVNCGTNQSSGNTVFFRNASLYAGTQFTITVRGTVSSDATRDTLSNTARVLVPNNLIHDSHGTNNSATDADARLSVSDLAITKTDGRNTYAANSPITYTVVVTNNGPSDAFNVEVLDSIPPQITSWTWTCTTVVNASGCDDRNSTVDFHDTVTIRNGGRIEYTVTANVTGALETISNAATINLSGGIDFIDPNSGNNTATDIDIPEIDLQITKDDGGVSYAAGGTVPYTVTITNNSTFDLTGITVSDAKPSQVTTWSWSCTGGCNPVTNSNANFTDMINLTAGSSLVYNVTANISPSAGTGIITNTAIVSAPAGLVDANPANNTATDTTPPYVDLQITKTDGVNTYTAGGALTYSVTVTNNSAFTVSGITVTDAMPSLISSWIWTCAPDPGPPGPICTAGPSNTNINDTAVNLPAGRSVTYTINATVSNTATGDLVNTAEVIAPAGYTDQVPGNNIAVDTNSQALAFVSGPPDISGPPDNVIGYVGSGTSLDLLLSTPITINGNGQETLMNWIRSSFQLAMEQIGTWFIIGETILLMRTQPLPAAPPSRIIFRYRPASCTDPLPDWHINRCRWWYRSTAKWDVSLYPYNSANR